MKAATKRKPMALLGARRFMVVSAKELSGLGLDWEFQHREFLTLGDARRKLTSRHQSPQVAAWRKLVRCRTLFAREQRRHAKPW
jgi:hypothetical protein